MSEAVMPNEQVPFEEGFAILDDASAEWAVKKIKQAREKAEMWKLFYEGQIKRAQEEAKRTEDYFTYLLSEYFEMVPHTEAKTQESYPLPSGKLVLKQQQPKYTPDDDELVPWLEKNQMNQMVKVAKKADWAALKKLVELTPDGKGVMMKDGNEIVPGVKVEPQDSVFKVEVK